MSVDCVLSCIKSIATAAKAVYDRFQQIDTNDEYRRRVLKNVKELEKLSVELQNLDEGDVSEVVQENLMKVNDSLSLVTSICNSVSSQGVFKRLVDATSEHTELQQLDTNTQRARESLQMAVQLATYNQGRQIKEDIRRETQEVKNVVQHAEAGIYINPHASRPVSVETFSVSSTLEGDLVEIKWKDCKNDIENIERYEIQFDDETSKILPLPASKIVAVDHLYSVRLGEPHLNAGSIYSVKVRAVSGSGPGEWSKTLTFRFKAGPPARPKKPKVVVASPKEVLVEIKMLSKSDERGNPVTHCEVQYIELDQNNDTLCEWLFLNVALNQQVRASDTKKFKIGCLKPYTKYKFRVKMINSVGKSDPSEAVTVITECLTPGPPTNIRISSKRTSDALKVRWDPPACNSDGVQNYVVQYRRLKRTEWATSATVKSSKLSHKVTNLKSDTFYEFRVKTLNHNGEGDSSNIAKGETRYGAFGRALGTVAAFGGGTVGGPLIGATGMGYLSASAAKEVPDSGTGKAAAATTAGIAGGVVGAALGTIGAPVMGLSAALMASQKLKGNLDITSPQTSDDEGTANSSIIGTIAKQAMTLSDNVGKN